MTLDEIKGIIEKNIPECTALVMDPMNDGEHLQAIVVSPAFRNLMLVKQHQMVMKPLKEAFAGPVHALALRTFTPEKWAIEKTKYGF